MKILWSALLHRATIINPLYLKTTSHYGVLRVVAKFLACVRSYVFHGGLKFTYFKNSSVLLLFMQLF